MSSYPVPARPLTPNSARDLAELNQLVDNLDLQDEESVSRVDKFMRQCLENGSLNPEVRIGLHQKSLGYLAAEMNDVDLLTSLVGNPFRDSRDRLRVDLMHEAIKSAVERNNTRALIFLSRNYPEHMGSYCCEIEARCHEYTIAFYDQQDMCLGWSFTRDQKRRESLQKKIENLWNIVLQAIPKEQFNEEDLEKIFGCSDEKVSSYAYCYLLNQLVDELDLQDQESVRRVQTLIRNYLDRSILYSEARVGSYRKSLRYLAIEMDDIDLLRRVGDDPFRYSNGHPRVDLMHEAIQSAVERSDLKVLVSLSRNHPEDIRKYCYEMEAWCCKHAAVPVDQSQLQKKIEDLLDIVFQAIPEGKIHEDDFEEIFTCSIRETSFYTYQYLLRRRMLPEAVIAKVASIHLDILTTTREMASLLEAGYPIDGPDANGASALSFACSFSKTPDLAFYLLENGARRDAVDKEGNTLMHLLFFYTDDRYWYENMEGLIRTLPQPSEYGKADITALNKKGESVFCLACRKRAPLGVLELLKELGADPAVGFGASSPVHEFLSQKREVVIQERTLADVQALRSLITPENINAKNKDGYTPLTLACKNFEPTEIIRALVDSGADKNCRNAEGNTPLHLLARSENVSATAIRVLMS